MIKRRPKKHQLEAISRLYLRGKHCWPRGAFRQFPAKQRYGSAYRKPLSCGDELSFFLHFNKDVYLSVFSDDQRKSKVYDVVFLDIDGKDLVSAHATLRHILAKLKAHEITNYVILFSGAKGFHVYVPFEPTLLYNYGIAVRRWISETLQILTMVDTAVLEPRRVSRIPYSRNLNGTYCVPVTDVDVEMGIDYIRKLSQDDRDLKVDTTLRPNPEMADQIREYDNTTVYADSKSVMTSKSTYFKTVADYPPCMSKLVLAAEDTDLGHSERLEMGKFLLHVYGGDRESVANHYKSMSDYNPRITGYQVDYLAENKLNISGCEKMQGYKICVFPKEDMATCPFYPSIHRVCRGEINA